MNILQDSADFMAPFLFSFCFFFVCLDVAYYLFELHSPTESNIYPMNEDLEFLKDY